MPVRRNVASLSAPERAALVAAIKAMKTRPDPDGVASNQYDKYVLQHSLTMRTPSPPNTDPNICNMAHRGPSFCPWHREFLRRFEQDLGVPLPYWDWAADEASGSPETAPVWGNDLMGPNGTPAPDPAINRPADAVTQGPFAHDPSDPASWSIIQDPALTPDPTVPWLTRQFGGMQPTLPTPQDVTTTLAVTPYDSPQWNVSSQGFRNTLEGFIGPGMHNAAHMWVGGSMMPSTSPNDPVFFLHHANVDRIWANWQRQWFHTPQGDYLPASGGPTGHNLTDGMFPWGGSTTPQSVLDTFALGYWYDDAPAPSVSGLNSATGTNGGGTSVVITGAGFMGATAVAFGPSPAATFTVDSDTQITATSPAGTGTVDITVTTPVGTSAASGTDQFTYTAPQPVVTAISPTSGTTAGGDTVTLTGTGFTGATAVAFGPSPAATFTVDSDTQITATSPAGTGTVDITVTTPAGVSPTSPADQFMFM
jgi:tyrosinase